tara:strand:+ start:4457 stop:4576 length:120 start_codon:yes stop_codon:yes gene_type:complete
MRAIRLKVRTFLNVGFALRATGINIPESIELDEVSSVDG